jgi:hypothetical protein
MWVRVLLFAPPVLYIIFDISKVVFFFQSLSWFLPFNVEDSLKYLLVMAYEKPNVGTVYMDN